MERNRNYLTLLVGVCIGTSILGSNLTSLRLSPKILLLSTYYRETLARRHRRHTNSRIFTVIFLIFFFFNFNYLCNRMLWLQIVEHSTKQRGNFHIKRRQEKCVLPGQFLNQKPKLSHPQMCSLSLKKLALASTIPSMHNHIESWLCSSASIYLQLVELSSFNSSPLAF